MAIAMTVPLTIATACDSVRPVVYLGGYCGTKSHLAIVLIARRLFQDLLRQPTGSVLTRDGHALFLMGSGTTVMVCALVMPS